MTIAEPVALFFAWSGLIAWTFAAVWLLGRWRDGYRMLRVLETSRREE